MIELAFHLFMSSIELGLRKQIDMLQNSGNVD